MKAARVDFEEQSGGLWEEAFSLNYRPPLEIVSTDQQSNRLLNFAEPHCLKAADSITLALQTSASAPISAWGTFRINTIVSATAIRIQDPDANICVDHTFIGIGYPALNYSADSYIGVWHEPKPAYKLSSGRAVTKGGSNIVYILGKNSGQVGPGDYLSVPMAGIDDALILGVSSGGDNGCGTAKKPEFAIAIDSAAASTKENVGWSAKSINPAQFDTEEAGTFSVIKEPTTDLIRSSLSLEGWPAGTRHYKILGIYGTERKLVVYGKLVVTHG